MSMNSRFWVMMLLSGGNFASSSVEMILLHPPMVAFKSSPTFVVPRKRNGREGEIRHS